MFYMRSFLDGLHCQLLSFFEGLLKSTLHIESSLGVIVSLSLQKCRESFNCVLELNELALAASKNFTNFWFFLALATANSEWQWCPEVICNPEEVFELLSQLDNAFFIRRQLDLAYEKYKWRDPRRQINSESGWIATADGIRPYKADTSEQTWVNLKCYRWILSNPFLPHL